MQGKGQKAKWRRQEAFQIEDCKQQIAKGRRRAVKWSSDRVADGEGRVAFWTLSPVLLCSRCSPWFNLGFSVVWPA